MKDEAAKAESTRKEVADKVAKTMDAIKEHE